MDYMGRQSQYRFMLQLHDCVSVRMDVSPYSMFEPILIKSKPTCILGKNNISMRKRIEKLKTNPHCGLNIHKKTACLMFKQTN